MDDFSLRPTSLARSLSSGKAVRPEETNRPMRLSRSSSDPSKSFLDKEEYLAKKMVAFPEEFKSATRYDDDDPYEGCFDDYDYDEPFTNPCYEGYYGEDDYGEDDHDGLNTNSNSSAPPTDNGTHSPGLGHVPSDLETMLQDQSSTPHHISLHDLKEITDNFSDGRILGHGGFGVVYKGILRNGKMVVVKNIVSSLIPGLQKQFESEMAERLLCLEYLPKGSLDKYLSDESSGFDWSTRYKIIKGICYGLCHLHDQIDKPIIHLDLKPANILIDDSLVPKIADFGLSRLFGQQQTICTSSCVGTFGYMAPEFIHGGIITPKLDIFSLGVIIMEIITGHRDYPHISRTSSNDFIELALEKWRNVLQRSPRCRSLEMDCHQIKRCIHVGLVCENPDHTKRPPIAKIISMLEGSESIDCNISNKVAQSTGQTEKVDLENTLVDESQRQSKEFGSFASRPMNEKFSNMEN